MSSKEIFNKIYENHVWGKGSGAGSGGNIANVYIKAVQEFLSDKNFKIIVDLGCGDFNIGKNLVSYCQSYIACDISSVILERNLKKYNYPNLSFRQLNFCEDDIPQGEAGMIREVLQHLSNDDIYNFTQKLNEEKPFKFLIFTDFLPKESFTPNIDKPTDQFTRWRFLESGVNLEEPPFYLSFKSKQNLCSVNHKSGVLNSIIYEL